MTTYRLAVDRAAARALAETLPPSVAAAALELIQGPLLTDPYRIGKALRPPLAPARSARRGAYRVLYVVDEEQSTVRVTAVQHRADAYRA